MDKANLINLYEAVMLNNKSRPTQSKKVKYISEALNEFRQQYQILCVWFYCPM
jgi:hypothetical protein